MNHAARAAAYKQVETLRDSRVIAFVTSDRTGAQTQIAEDCVPFMISALDKIGAVPRLSLVLDTLGGQTAVAWRLIRLLQSFCDELEVVVPSKAMSAGTLMALGADKIVMTKQAVLGPIDPSVEHPLGPTKIVGPQTISVKLSAEAIRGYLDEVAKTVNDAAGMAAIWTGLTAQVHPAVLGEIFRQSGQIRFMAAELIKRQVLDVTKQQAIIQLLCSDSGSHDYTINRRHASEIGLNIEKASEDLYPLLTTISQSYTEDLQTLVPLNVMALCAAAPTGTAVLTRGLVESTDDCFGYMTNASASGGSVTSTDGWRRLV